MQLNTYSKMRAALGLIVMGTVLIVGVSAFAQETGSEVSVQGTGFFTKYSDGKSIYDQPTKTGGLLVGYRYHFYRWLSLEGNYGYARNTQSFTGTASGRIQSNVHQVTGSAVVKLPTFAKFQPFVLAGGGGLVFDPTGNAGGTYEGASRQTRPAFLYGGGADYPLTGHWALRAEYRGYVYKTPTFDVGSFATNSWTHTAQPSAGIVFKF